MAGALDGMLVIAIEQAVAAPMCTLRLADGGARVIKIERTEGDTARHYDKTVHGVSAYFAWLNRGKESTVLDLKDEADLGLVRRMLAGADVFVQNLAPGAAARMGLDAQSLVREFPRLVAVDIAGYGQDTAYRDMRAYDLLVQAEAGLCSVTGLPDAPAKVGVSAADIATGMNAHALILEALIARGRSGVGQAIEVAMFDSIADWMSVPLLHWTSAGRDTARHGMSHAAIYPYAPFRCRDGEVIVAIQQPAEWRRFCSGVLGQSELAEDKRFATNPDRLTHRAELAAIIAALFSSMTCADAAALLDAHAIAWGRVSDVQGLARHKALRAMEVPVAGDTAVQMPRPPGRASLQARRPPQLGEHTEAIRAEFAKRGIEAPGVE
ncbi:CaiB/BaiF CoA transferase family protein [Aestuariivirga sp.]|jgi:crotonobetainyl-CoA:carnitine CoA-transferase CaiB-like acyl-CoA transferase|uniref:CaiB/BaiF CoA transferase family protein n=1 Tax=Aestuariivirga sp. TaxID=2650926 RepID=UPI0037832CB2